MNLVVNKMKRTKSERTKWWKLKLKELRQALGGHKVLPDDWTPTANVIRGTGRRVLGVRT